MIQRTEYLGYEKIETGYRFHYFVTFANGRVTQTRGYLDVSFADMGGLDIKAFEQWYIEMLAEQDYEASPSQIGV